MLFVRTNPDGDARLAKVRVDGCEVEILFPQYQSSHMEADSCTYLRSLTKILIRIDKYGSARLDRSRPLITMRVHRGTPFPPSSALPIDSR
jgi:hypothetical protein